MKTKEELNEIIDRNANSLRIFKQLHLMDFKKNTSYKVNGTNLRHIVSLLNALDALGRLEEK